MKKNRERLYNQQDFFSKYKYNNLNSQKRRKTKAKNLMKEIIVENFQNLERELDTQAHKPNRQPYYLKTKRTSPRHI